MPSTHLELHAPLQNSVSAKQGTKLGCGEGGCGACTVTVSQFEDNRVVHRAATRMKLDAGHEGGGCSLGIWYTDVREIVTNTIYISPSLYHIIQCLHGLRQFFRNLTILCVNSFGLLPFILAVNCLSFFHFCHQIWQRARHLVNVRTCVCIHRWRGGKVIP